MSESADGPSQLYHQSNLTMPDMGLAMGMKPDASPPTPRSLRLMPNASGGLYGQSTEELRRVANVPHYLSQDNMQQQLHPSPYGAQDRSSLGRLPVNTTTAAAIAAAAKKKSIKSSLGRLFSKKEKVWKLLLIYNK